MAKHVVWAWVKECWRPVDSYREIKRGKCKGQFELTLPNGKKAVTDRKHVRGLPPESPVS